MLATLLARKTIPLVNARSSHWPCCLLDHLRVFDPVSHFSILSEVISLQCVGRSMLSQAANSVVFVALPGQMPMAGFGDAFGVVGNQPCFGNDGIAMGQAPTAKMAMGQQLVFALDHRLQPAPQQGESQASYLQLSRPFMNHLSFAVNHHFQHFGLVPKQAVLLGKISLF